jgi:hypothetical protein
MKRFLLNAVYGLTCVVTLAGSALAQRHAFSGGHATSGGRHNDTVTTSRQTGRRPAPFTGQGQLRPTTRPGADGGRPTGRRPQAGRTVRHTDTMVRRTTRAPRGGVQQVTRTGSTTTAHHTGRQPLGNRPHADAGPAKMVHGHPHHPGGKGMHGNNGFVLNIDVNARLIGIRGNPNVSPGLADALGAVLCGTLPSDDQTQCMVDAVNDGNLDGGDRAAIASALQCMAVARPEQSEQAAGSDAGAGSDVAGTQEAPAEEAVFGLKITHLPDGTAKEQGLMLDDVILSYNGTDTPTFEALRDAVQQSSGAVEVIFLNSENGQRESITLYPQGRRIGVGGESVRVD